MSSLDGHLGWFHFFAIVDRVAANMDVQGALAYGMLS